VYILSIFIYITGTKTGHFRARLDNIVPVRTRFPENSLRPGQL